ncbi:MAG: bifunctional folylpolyglutamate synthase/dihydrofolate synthase [Desulfomonilia bacterium]
MVLSDLDQNRWSLGLTRVRNALDLLGHPERSYQHVLVAGTNGKGSTCVYLERLLTCGGLKVGTTISPHVSVFEERFRIHGCSARPYELEEIRKKAEHSISHLELTYFEWCVILAVMLFAEYSVDVGIFEVGLGGRYDACNALDPAFSLITEIARDHTEYLGTTITQIAREKVEISRPGRPVVTTNTGEGLDVIRDHCRRIGAPLIEITQPYQGPTGMNGSQQGLNAALALEASALLGVSLDIDEVTSALNCAFLPGRLEYIGEHLILDVAHNPSSMLVLVHHLETKGFSGVGVVGILADKEYETLARMLKQVCSHLFIAPVPSVRSWGDAEMEKVISLGEATRCTSISDAFSRAAETGKDIVVTGSFYTVCEVRQCIVCHACAF